MSKIEIPEEIAALARKVGRQFKSEQDLADFSRLLKKITVEAALGGEIATPAASGEVPGRSAWRRARGKIGNAGR